MKTNRINYGIFLPVEYAKSAKTIGAGISPLEKKYEKHGNAKPLMALENISL